MRLFYVSRASSSRPLNWLIRNVVGYVVFAAIVLLQADIRRALAHLGPRAVLPPLRRPERADETVEELVVAAATLLAKQKSAR